MKKKYFKPAAVIVKIQSCSIICQSQNPYSTMESGDIFEDAPLNDNDYIVGGGEIR